jgi:hypothetical protein
VRTLDVGHMVYWDAFEATAAIVAAFVAGAPVPPDAHVPPETAQRMA